MTLDCDEVFVVSNEFKHHMILRGSFCQPRTFPSPAPFGNSVGFDGPPLESDLSKLEDKSDDELVELLVEEEMVRIRGMHS